MTSHAAKAIRPVGAAWLLQLTLHTPPRFSNISHEFKISVAKVSVYLRLSVSLSVSLSLKNSTMAQTLFQLHYELTPLPPLSGKFRILSVLFQFYKSKQFDKQGQNNVCSLLYISVVRWKLGTRKDSVHENGTHRSVRFFPVRAKFL